MLYAVRKDIQRIAFDFSTREICPTAEQEMGSIVATKDDQGLESGGHTVLSGTALCHHMREGELDETSCHRTPHLDAIWDVPRYRNAERCWRSIVDITDAGS